MTKNLTERALTLARRSELLWSLRSFFREEGFLELEPPSIVTCPGMEPHLDAFELKARYAHHGLEQSEAERAPRRWLHTSPEHALKRLLGEGFERVYAIGPCYRDEPPSSTHNPEFTMLEWYMKGAELPELMTQCERLIQALATRAASLLEAGPQAADPDHLQRLKSLSARHFERLSVREAFIRYADLELPPYHELSLFKEAALRAGVRASALERLTSWDELYFQVFLDLIEPQLGRERPVFLYDFPSSQSALAKLKPDDPRWALRFELFDRGYELANAFDELSDPVEQRARFVEELATRAARGAPRYPLDEPLLEVLPQLGQCVGIALGFDRLVMTLLGRAEISEVLAQPWGER
jgi:lysyl-tRNA synthetase class 2